MKNSWRRLILIIMLLASLPGCLPNKEPLSPPPWQYADLRLLASPGDGSPSHQLVSLYTRRFNSEDQIRLDLLDFEADLDYDLYLALDTTPGGTSLLPIQAEADLEWDLLLIIPASGPLQARRSDGAALQDLKLRVLRNPTLDTVVISLNGAHLQSPYQVQVYLTPQNSLDVASSLGPVRSDAWPPPRLPVLLAFWNTFTAYTPAQALRRYDGAHSGPASDRHGLRGLLEAVEATRFPAVLLDVKHPISLSALDYAGALPQLQDLEARDLLILPDQLPLGPQTNSPFTPPTWARVQSAVNARQVAQDFGLSPSSYLYSATFPDELTGSLLQQVGDYLLLFSNQVTDQTESASNLIPEAAGQSQQSGFVGNLTPSVSRWGAYTWVDLSSVGQALSATVQASYTGPSMDIRLALLTAAVSNGADQFVVLGGNLTQTAWGNPQAALQTLEYLSSRPWIQPVTKAHLATLSTPSAGLPAPPSPVGSDISPQEPVLLNNPIGEPNASGLTAQQIQDNLLQALKSAPDNAANQLAWQAYEALSAPAVLSTPLLASLRAAYLGQIGQLLAAARWGSEGPQAFCSLVEPSISCQARLDLDWDGEVEYVLVSANFFAVFEARGGYLSLAFVRSPNGIHQIISPSTQFVVGMGDPSSWNPELGVAGDPSQLRGAFSDLPAGSVSPSWELYTFASDGESLAFTSPDGSLHKTIRLLPSGLQVDYASNQPVTIQIPIAIEPEARFYPGWGRRYEANMMEGGWSSTLKEGLQVRIQTTENCTAQSFSDSLEYMGRPENPDFDYPLGHFLPFPLTLVDIRSQGEFSILLTVVIK